MHTEEKPNLCSVCDQVIIQNNTFKHSLFKILERPHKISYCEKSFSQKSSWDKINIHRGDSILMQTLWQTFLQKKNSNFKLYLRKHTGEAHKKYHLEIHLRKHIGENFFSEPEIVTRLSCNFLSFIEGKTQGKIHTNVAIVKRLCHKNIILKYT